LFRKRQIDILTCVSCGHQFAGLEIYRDHVDRHYGDSYFNGGGAGYADYTRDAAIMRMRGRRYARLLEKYCRPGVLLDVGAAAGFILQGFLREGWTGMGLEPNGTMSRYAREVAAVDVCQGSIEYADIDRTFDLITLLQVLAHFPHPSQAIAQVARWCRPGGHCLIETWDRGSWMARLMGEHWHEYSPPTVLHFFDRQAVDRLMHSHGFRPVAAGRPGKWISVSHARSLVQHHFGNAIPGKVAAIPLRLLPPTMPLPYPAFDLFWSLYKKQ
jgi:SAM-dependent methyltransferase